MTEELNLKDFTNYSLLLAGVGAVSDRVVGEACRYLLGFHQVTPLTGVITGTVFGGLYPLAMLISGVVAHGLVLQPCGVESEWVSNFSVFGGGAVIDFAVTPLVAGLIGFPISYWQFIAQAIAQIAVFIGGVAVYKLLCDKQN